MKKSAIVLGLAVLGLGFLCPVRTEAVVQEFQNLSPDAGLEFDVYLSEKGELSYQVKKGEDTVPETGSYLIRLHYLTGDNRNIDITVNGREKYRANCFDSGGFDKLEYKEVLVRLEQGSNTLVLGNENEYCPDLDRIEIIKL